MALLARSGKTASPTEADNRYWLDAEDATPALVIPAHSTYCALLAAQACAMQYTLMSATTAERKTLMLALFSRGAAR
ncbi:MAG TPA: hypothetical protein PKJ50_00780, partial [Casimicrobium huifangae]|nr:hypothetical protein [Casimicrobium huifangae]